MIPAASTAAWAIHDLGLATSFGGALFGRMALNPALETISDREERGEMVHTAWRRFSILNLLSHIGIAATWFAGRGMLTGEEIDENTRRLVKAKDALVAVSVLSGVTSIVAGQAGMREPDTEKPPALDKQGNVGIEASARARQAAKITSVAGIINLASLAGILGITAVLAMKAGGSRTWPSTQRDLP